MRMIVTKAERLWKIPQSVMGNMAFSRKRLEARNVEVIDLERFVPEVPDVRPFKEKIEKFGVPSTAGPESLSRLRELVARRHQSLKTAELDPEHEIVITPGIYLTATLVSLGLVNPGDLAAYPDPGMPYFRTATALADGIPRKYQLLESNDYIMNITSLLASPHKRMKILFLNYPHNPTGASVDFYFYREMFKALRFSHILPVADCAHIHPGNPDAAGPLQVKNASGKVLELHTFSTTLGLPGLGFAAGHKDVVAIIQSLLDSQGFAPDERQVGWAIAGFEHAEEIFYARMETLRRRREILSEGLKHLEWRVRGGGLLPFLWVRPPVHGTSINFARRIFVKAGIKVSPGTDFGENGEGWLRLTLSPGEGELKEALERLSGHSRIWQRKFKPGE